MQVQHKGWKDASGAISFLLKLTLYAMIFATFFCLMSVETPYVLIVSRTMGITMSTFVLVGMMLSGIFGGYAIGKQKSKPIIYSLTLASVLTDVITYVQLLIMNTHPENRAYLQVQGIELLLLAAIIVIQFVLIVAMTYLGNYIFFRINPPEKCLIVASSRRACENMLPKIGRFRLQYRVEKIVDYRHADLHRLVRQADTVFLLEVPYGERASIMEYCYKHNKNVYCNLEITDVLINSAKHVMLDDASFLGYAGVSLTPEQKFLKRTMDIVGSSLGLLLLSPVMLVCALAIRLSDKGPVFFIQQRATENGRHFWIYKFRTMRQDTGEKQYSALQGDDRITPVGRVLRRWRLDELPQLYNILKGDMSIVGPRPEMIENVSQYVQDLPQFEYRLKVKAGLTGYAQIAGKYNTSPKDKMMLDLYYIENYSLWLDIKMLLRTLTVFFKADSTEGFGCGAAQVPVEFEEEAKAE